MKKIIYISILAVLLAACGSNNSEVENIKVEIPEALTNNADAKELVEDMTDAVNSCRNNMAIGAQFAFEQEKSGSDSLTFKQGFKAAKFAAKMMFAAKKIEKVRAEAQELKPELSETEWLALETKLDELETSVGDIDPEALGLSEEDINNLKAEEGLEASAEEQELRPEELEQNKQDLESGMALREQEMDIQQTARENAEAQGSDNESNGGSGWLAIAFTLLVIFLVIFGVIFSIRRIIRRMKYTANNLRNFNKS